MTLWPFSAISDWLAWRARDRDETIVATWEAFTSDENGNQIAAHIVNFLQNGNGRRCSTVLSTEKVLADRHPGILIIRQNWRIHGILHTSARLVEPEPKTGAVSATGGAA